MTADNTTEAGLGHFGLTEQDFSFSDAAPSTPLPVVAVVGRPNVGKSTLVNRIIGRREAVVDDVPGVTRDRVRYDAHWNGREFTLVDTGGWERDATGRAAEVVEQAEFAMSTADVVLFVVDATVGSTDADEDVTRVLRRAQKPVLLVANKVDNERLELEATSLWSMGLGEPHPVSAIHGRGSGDLLDAVVAALPPGDAVPEPTTGPVAVALLGRPNVGKSSLLNKIAGESRAVVDSVAGTTVDPVDELVDIDGTTWKLVDTAGIRKRVRTASGQEYFASLRTQAALDRCSIAVVLIESQEPVSEQDLRILNMVTDSGRALVLAMNKWDLVDEERRFYLEREIERDLQFVAWAPRINISASSGWHVNRLGRALDEAHSGWHTRVPTSALNSFLAELAAAHPHPVRSGKQPRVLFATQASVGPPTFVLFASGFLEAGYRRFIERRLREEFGFVGSPIRISVRVRERQSRRRTASGS